MAQWFVGRLTTTRFGKFCGFCWELQIFIIVKIECYIAFSGVLVCWEGGRPLEEYRREEPEGLDTSAGQCIYPLVGFPDKVKGV